MSRSQIICLHFWIARCRMTSWRLSSAAPKLWWVVVYLALVGHAVCSPLPGAGTASLERSGQDPGVEAYSRGAFAAWTALAAAQVTSPAAAVPGDLVRRWEAPDHRAIQTVVKLPHPARGAPDITMSAVPAGVDARPYFEAALAAARQKGAAKLNIPPGTYVFKSLGENRLGHLVLQNLSDITIDGQGSTFVFTQNEPGIFIRASQRLRLFRINIDYSLRMASIGTIQQRGGQKVLVIDPAYPVTADDHVYFVSEFNPATREWVPGGKRAIMPPGMPNPAVFLGHQTYASSTFAPLPAGKPYVVSHHFYGGPAIRVGDSPGPGQPQDVVIDHVTIWSGPGAGIIAYGVKRGFAVVNSRIMPKPDGHSLISTEYDAIHILELGGDLILSDNVITGQGDDGINLNNPISLISRADPAAKTIVLAPYSRFISPGDTLAFFDRTTRFVGTATATVVTPLGGLNYQVGLRAMPPGFDPQDIVRNVSRIDGRFAVTGNKISKCNCHGILVQIPNGLVETNEIHDTKANAIRLLSSIGTFKEGVGAINVIVRDNVIARTGSDNAIDMPWAAISAYAPVGGNALSRYPVNKDLLISGNTISHALDACITISSSLDVKVLGNRCDSVMARGLPPGSINVFRSSDVELAGNTRAGVSSGGITIDRQTSLRVVTQDGY